MRLHNFWTGSSLIGTLALVGTSSVHGRVNVRRGVTLGPSSYQAGPLKSIWRNGYYNNPTGTIEEPQPKVSDPVSGKTYPYKLTSPKDFPKNNTVDPFYLPPVQNKSRLHDIFVTQISSIINAPNATYGGVCGKCKAGLQVAQSIALVVPEIIPSIAVSLCTKFSLFSASTCQDDLASRTFGQTITQVLANADVGGVDGQAICAYFISSSCPIPAPAPLNLTTWFTKPKPSGHTAPVPPVNGKRLKVLHVSDFHIDPRYEIGAEANCTGVGGLCCRNGNFNPSSPGKVLLPAPRYGAFECDVPFDLALASLESIPVLTGTNGKGLGFDFSIYTGDLVSHDHNLELGRDYVEYTETVVFGLFKRQLNSGPIFATLGNHDSVPQAQAGPTRPSGFANTPSKDLVQQFSWNYDHISKLWAQEGWLDAPAVRSVNAHYGAYSVKWKGGLRIISLNTDYWYKPNYYNYINWASSDPGGMLRFLTDELQAAEDAKERVWIIGHVLSGWDGTNPLPNPTNLFYQIVDRFSPHVVAAIFFGHTHEDQFMIYYANNASSISAETAQTVGWIGPSITPLTNLNTGFRVYEVDAQTFDILDAHTWYSNVSSFQDLESLTAHGPSYLYEYSTRELYGQNISWPSNAPLNATWWHKVTEQMELNPSLVQTFTVNQGKHSVKSPPCTSSDCVTAKICYMRSGSVPIAQQNCKTGFGSVQGG